MPIKIGLRSNQIADCISLAIKVAQIALTEDP